jgi:hypothetical protein
MVALVLKPEIEVDGLGSHPHIPEVARTGQILGAARRLGVNHATVARQLTALEQELKTQLVETAYDGLRPDKRRRGPRCCGGAG